MDMALTKLRLKRVFRFEMLPPVVWLSHYAWQVCREIDDEGLPSSVKIAYGPFDAGGSAPLM